MANDGTSRGRGATTSMEGCDRRLEGGNDQRAMLQSPYMWQICRSSRLEVEESLQAVGKCYRCFHHQEKGHNGKGFQVCQNGSGDASRDGHQGSQW